MKAFDPVCTMEVDTETAIFKSHYEGQTYYFCASGCKSLFKKYPQRYVKQAARMQSLLDQAPQGASNDE